MGRRFKRDDSTRPDRGQVLNAAELEKVKSFSRYLDVDGDGIAARTLPGVHAKGAYFVRGSGHNKHGQYTEDSDEYQEVLDRIARKIDGAAEHLPAPEFHLQEGAEIGLISIGGCHGAMLEAMDVSRNRASLPTTCASGRSRSRSRFTTS